MPGRTDIRAAWAAALLELIRRTATQLPADVAAALNAAQAAEREPPRAGRLLRALAANADLAARAQTPLCQDTGAMHFFWQLPPRSDHPRLAAATADAVRAATRLGLLRRNTIDTLSDRSVDDNVAPGSPVCHFEQRPGRATEVWLLLKGGGSENAGGQYALPAAALQAGRDLEGVRRCLLQAVWEAQGGGCAPGIVGACIGSDRAGGYLHAERQLLRPLPDRAPDPALAALEERVLAEANSLGIGPMGMGGRTTLLGVKLAARCRLPASYFVSVAYSCWACRRRGLRAGPQGGSPEWLG